MNDCQHEWEKENDYDRYRKRKLIGHTTVHRCIFCKKVKVFTQFF